MRRFTSPFIDQTMKKPSPQAVLTAISIVATVVSWIGCYLSLRGN